MLGVGDLAGDGGYKGYINDLVVQPNGKIIGVGVAYNAASSGNVSHIVRWLPDGSLDPSFGNGGDKIVAVSGTPGIFADYVALQEDGKVVVAGEYVHPGGTTTEPVILRFKTDGHLDLTFGVGGIFQMPGTYPEGREDQPGGLAIRPDGTIAFSVVQLADPLPEVEIVQLKGNGVLDSAFGSNGVSIFLSGSDASSLFDFTIQPDGEIAGNAKFVDGEFGGEGLVYRLLSTGALDPKFNHKKGWRPASTQAMGALPFNQILFSGGLDADEISTGRFRTDGLFDTTFTTSDGGDAIVRTPVPTGSATPVMSGLKVQSDGRFIVAGYNGRILMVRYQGDPLVLTPAAFSFTNVTSVPVSTVQVSNVVTIASLTPSAMVPITVVGGSYSVNGAPFTALLGYVKNGDQVMVKHTSAATSHTSMTTKLKIGGVNDPKSLWAISGTRILATFTSTTQ